MIRIKSRRDIVAWLREAACIVSRDAARLATPGEILAEIEEHIAGTLQVRGWDVAAWQRVAAASVVFAESTGIATRDELIAEAERTNQTKGRDYTQDGDILRNFYRVAERVKISPLQVVAVYVLKHLDALDTFVATGKLASSEPAASRVMDIFLYAALAAAICQREASK